MVSDRESALGRKTFEALREIAYSQAGIHLNDKKKALVSSRIAKRLRELQLSSPEDYLNFLKLDSSGEELVNFINAISTNYTYFFREDDHFEIMEKYFIKWLDEHQSRFRFWCAASATGEEPYSIILKLMKFLNQGNIDFKLLATDISTKALDAAKAGVYPLDKLKTIPPEYRIQYTQKINSEAGHFTFKNQVKNKIVFKRLNLSRPPFPMKGPLDLVFCRNVMIYFDNSVRQNLISNIESLLKPGGLLITGHSETLRSIDTEMIALTPSVYLKPYAGDHYE
ncbi:MAG: chemotaxis protein CheR [Deltaproteobacteria bacterium]|nr:chemotaxis protein CheR [Deltaproteobacteria bacterium]